VKESKKLNTDETPINADLEEAIGLG